MLRRHFNMAFRQIGRNAGHSAVVVACLGLGIAVSLLAAAFLVHEFSYESCHANSDRIHRVYVEEFSSSFGDLSMATAPLPLGPALVEANPGIEEAVRLRRLRDADLHAAGLSLFGEDILAVEPAFARVFNVDLIQGNPEVDLAAPGNIYLTASLAIRLFGSENPIGQKVQVDKDYELFVTGLIGDMPTNTKLRCDALMSLASVEAAGTDFSDWSSIWNDYLFLLLATDCDPGSVEASLPSILNNYLDEDEATTYKYALQPLDGIYFGSDLSNELPPNGNLDQVRLAVAIALATLLIACFNFINLTTARATCRLNEMVMRKVVGASRRQLIAQLVVETFVPAVMAAVLGMVLFELSHRLLASVLGRPVDMGLLQNWMLPAIVLTLVLIVTLIAGLYPAFYVSRPRFVNGVSLMSRGRGGRAYLRKSLVVLQFAAAVVISIMATVVYVQMHFSQTWDKGFRSDGVVVLNCGGNDATEATSAFRQELSRLPGVLGTTGCGLLPGMGSAALDQFRPAADPEAEGEMIQVFDVEETFAQVMGMSLQAGRFTDETDRAAARNILVDSRTVETLGLPDPIGAVLIHKDEELTIVGVLDGFHARPTFMDELPLMFRINTDAPWNVLVKIAPEKQDVTIGRIVELWSRFVPEQPLEYEYLDDKLNQQYNSYYRLGTLFLVFSGVFVLISGLGMFSLATLAANGRRREIGIRKVFGATAASIVGKLGGEYLVLVATANLIGIPVAWYLGNRWLEGFVHRAELGPAVFVSCGLGTLAIALISVMIQTLRAANANPVDALKYE